MAYLYAALMLLLAMPFPAVTPRKDGNWEITVELDVNGQPGRVPPRTTTQCITPEEAARDKKAVPRPGDAVPGDCTASDHKVDGNKVTWSFKCETPRQVSGTAEIVYTDDSHYTGSLTFQRDDEAMTIKYSGTRLGDCTK